MIRTLIVDDHPVVRAGIDALLKETDDIEVIGHATNGGDAIEMTDDLVPDVILMDLVMPGVDGIKAIQEISARQPSVKIIVLTAFSSNDKLFPAINAGTAGYMLKEGDPRDLINSIRSVANGESYLHPRVASKVLDNLNKRRLCTDEDNNHKLTYRELEVLDHIAHGMTNSETAEKLCISETTVRTHVSNILFKLHLKNRVQAALYALKEGLVQN